MVSVPVTGSIAEFGPEMDRVATVKFNKTEMLKEKVHSYSAQLGRKDTIKWKVISFTTKSYATKLLTF